MNLLFYIPANRIVFSSHLISSWSRSLKKYTLLKIHIKLNVPFYHSACELSFESRTPCTPNFTPLKYISRYFYGYSPFWYLLWLPRHPSRSGNQTKKIWFLSHRPYFPFRVVCKNRKGSRRRDMGVCVCVYFSIYDVSARIWSPQFDDPYFYSNSIQTNIHQIDFSVFVYMIRGYMRTHGNKVKQMHDTIKKGLKRRKINKTCIHTHGYETEWMDFSFEEGIFFCWEC